MIAFLADQNFRAAIVRGVRRSNPAVDIVRVQDVGLRTVGDPEILDWAARGGRVLLTHDVSTVPAPAWERVGAGLPMPGVLAVPDFVPVAVAIADVLTVAELDVRECEGRVRFLPIR